MIIICGWNLEEEDKRTPSAHSGIWLPTTKKIFPIGSICDIKDPKKIQATFAPPNY